MKYISLECKITKEEAHELLMMHKDHGLWNKHYHNWTALDLENLRSGINKMCFKRHIRHQRVLVVLNDGTKKEYASIKSVSNVTKLSQSTVSNILAGRKTTNKFLSIKKV
jgi:hypothetical protein